MSRPIPSRADRYAARRPALAVPGHGDPRRGSAPRARHARRTHESRARARNRPCRQRCNRRSSRTPSALADPPSSDTLKIKSPQPGQLIFCRTATAPALFSGAAPARPVPIVPPLVVALSADRRSIVSASIRCQPPRCGGLLRQCVTTQTCDLGKHLGACACAVGSRRLRAHEQRGSHPPYGGAPASVWSLPRPQVPNDLHLRAVCAPLPRPCRDSPGVHDRIPG